MLRTLRAQVSLENDTAIPRDVAQNTWHFMSDSVDPLDDVASIDTSLHTFYEAIDEFFSENVTGSMITKYYDLLDPEPRTPINTIGHSLEVSTGTAFPNEVAACLSYRGALVSGTEPKRRRGRIFLGPLAVATSANGAGDSQLATSFMEAVGGAASVLLEEAETHDWAWCVFSPTTAGPPTWSSGTLAASSFQVVGGHVDNAFDTVRSRGILATDRFGYGAEA